ncbi:MAG: hypothetical protein PsegKO_27920 [Pseudohongiellaceae bacterium]
MNRKIAKFLLAGFAKKHDYDVKYLENMAAVSPGAFYRYLLTAPLAAYRKQVPGRVYFSARMIATKHIDCGPCLRLVINTAREAGVDASLLRAVLTDNVTVIPDDVALGINYANAVMTKDAVRIVELNKQITQRWGEAALTDLALAVAFAAFFPTLRRGLGHAQSCESVIQELERSSPVA